MKKKFLLLSEKLSRLQIKVLLFLVYILIICPIAIIWKVIRKDPLMRKIDKSLGSYMLPYDKTEIRVDRLDKPY